MSAWKTVHLDTGTEGVARDLATQLGSDLEPDKFSAGSQNYCFTAYTPLDVRDEGGNPLHDDFDWAFAVLARFNTALPEGLAAYQAVISTPYVKTTSNPSNVWA